MDVCVKCNRPIEHDSDKTIRIKDGKCVCSHCWVNNDRSIIYRYIINKSLEK